MRQVSIRSPQDKPDLMAPIYPWRLDERVAKRFQHQLQSPAKHLVGELLPSAEADPDGDPGGPEEHQGSVTLGFGDSADTQGRSAFIDNLHYAAIETPGTTQVSVLENGEDESDPLPASPASSTSYLVSGDQLGVTQFFPDTFQETSQGSASGLLHELRFPEMGRLGHADRIMQILTRQHTRPPP